MSLLILAENLPISPFFSFFLTLHKFHAAKLIRLFKNLVLHPLASSLRCVWTCLLGFGSLYISSFFFFFLSYPRPSLPVKALLDPATPPHLGSTHAQVPPLSGPRVWSPWLRREFWAAVKAPGKNWVDPAQALHYSYNSPAWAPRPWSGVYLARRRAWAVGRSLWAAGACRLNWFRRNWQKGLFRPRRWA